MQGLLQWNLNMSKDSHSPIWHKSLRTGAGFFWCLPVWPLESSETCWAGEALAGCGSGHLMVLKVLFNSNHSIVYVWKFQRIASKLEQHCMIFLAWLCWETLLILSTVPPCISLTHTQMAFVGGDVADGYNRKPPFCSLVLCLSRGSWLADPAAAVSTLDKHQ